MNIDTTMTVDELLELLNDYSIGGTLEEVSVVVEAILTQILSNADFYYNEYAEDGTCAHAVALASNAIKDFPYGEANVRQILDHMGEIADDLIEHAKGLSPATRARLAAVRNSHPDLAEPAAAGRLP